MADMDLTKQRVEAMTHSWKSTVKKIYEYPVLAKDEEEALYLRWKNDKDEKAREQIIQSYFRLVLSIARRNAEHSAQVPELFNVGVLGLIYVLDRNNEREFDPQKGTLGAIAKSWILSCIQRYKHEQHYLIANVSLGHLWRCKNEIGGREGLAPLPKSVYSLDNLLSVGSEQTFREMFAVEDETPEDVVSKKQCYKELKKAFRSALKSLSERERFIIRARCFNEPRVKFKYLSRHFCITKERVRQLELRAKNKIKQHLLAHHRGCLINYSILG